MWWWWVASQGNVITIIIRLPRNRYCDATRWHITRKPERTRCTWSGERDATDLVYLHSIQSSSRSIRQINSSSKCCGRRVLDYGLTKSSAPCPLSIHPSTMNPPTTKVLAAGAAAVAASPPQIGWHHHHFWVSIFSPQPNRSKPNQGSAPST